MENVVYENVLAGIEDVNEFLIEASVDASVIRSAREHLFMASKVLQGYKPKDKNLLKVLKSAESSIDKIKAELFKIQ